MTWKSTVFMSGAGLLATWLASAPPAAIPQDASSRARQVSPTAPVSAASLATRAADVDIVREAERLQAHAAERAAYREPARDLFRFGAAVQPRVRRAVRPAAPVAPALPVAVEPPPVSVRLSGVAADLVDGIEQRTAIFSSATGVLLAREGEQVDGLLVVAVDAEAAVLQRPGGETVRLTLAPR